jgi:hypothetical protein
LSIIAKNGIAADRAPKMNVIVMNAMYTVDIIGSVDDASKALSIFSGDNEIIVEESIFSTRAIRRNIIYIIEKVFMIYLNSCFIRVPNI